MYGSPPQNQFIMFYDCGRCFRFCWYDQRLHD